MEILKKKNNKISYLYLINGMEIFQFLSLNAFLYH